MLHIAESPLFTRWRDPVSGVESLILSRRVAPLQQSFYFTQSGFSDDGRHLWFYASFPPGGDAYYGRQLGVADLGEQTVRLFPETRFADASPFVDGTTGEAYWTTGLEVWKRGPLPADRAERVGAFPSDLANNRRPLRLATHLSLSPDRRTFCLDALLGAECFVGTLAADGSGEYRLWKKFDCCFNHAQFSPVDPGLILLAHDGWFDPATGERGAMKDRMWLLRRDGEIRPVCPGDPVGSDLRGHEWWQAGGVHVWYIDYHHGTAKVHLATGEQTRVWPGGHTHSSCDRTGRYVVGDINPQHIRMDMWRVAFFNTVTGKEVDIVSDLPGLPYPRSRYHVHPHPRFCLDDTYVCYTTNVLGTVDVALVSVEELIARTSSQAEPIGATGCSARSAWRE